MDRTAFLHDIQKISLEIKRVKTDFDKDIERLCGAFDQLVSDFERAENDK